MNGQAVYNPSSELRNDAGSYRRRDDSYVIGHEGDIAASLLWPAIFRWPRTAGC